MEQALLSHTTLGVADVHVARRFYGPLLEALGLTLKFADETWAGWKHPRACEKNNGRQARYRCDDILLWKTLVAPVLVLSGVRGLLGD
jgi:hypothetical protein